MRTPSRLLLVTAMVWSAGCRHCPTHIVATPAPPAATPLPAGPARLKILTWNIWMMPWFTFQSPHNRKRAAAIADELLKQDFDILCFEKAFDGGARSVLLKGALGTRYRNHYGPANSGSLKVNSGLWILSRIPLSESHEIQFRDCAGIECASRKGAMLLSGQFEGRAFQLLVTHLQGEAGNHYTPEHQQIRNRQMTQIRNELVARYAKPGVPLFAAGDFDTPRRDPGASAAPGVQPPESDGYRFMLRTFGDALNGEVDRVTFDDNCSHNDLAMANQGRADELDYILIQPNGADLMTDWSRVVLRHPGEDGRRQDLSYRYAVGVSIQFR